MKREPGHDGKPRDPPADDAVGVAGGRAAQAGPGRASLAISGVVVCTPWCTGVIIDVAALDVLDSFGFTTIRRIAEVARLCGALTVTPGSSRMWRWPRSGSGWAPARSPPLSTSRRAWRTSTGSTLEHPAASMSHAARWRASVGVDCTVPVGCRPVQAPETSARVLGGGGGRGLCERVSA